MTEASRRHPGLLPGGAALGVATVALFLVSRGKWSDALIDSGNVWMIPFTISQGALLYRDVVYWFGPFTPYFHGAVFRILGPTFSTLVVAGILGSVATIAALYYAIRRVVARTEALLWSALAIPALVFMPNSGGAVLGMGYRMWHAATFALLAVAVLVGSAPTHRGRRGLLAGGLAGVAGLCRTEWGLLTLLVAVLVPYRGEEDGRAWRAAFAVAAGFLLVFGGVFLLFGVAAGWPALLQDAPVLLFNLPAETRAHAAFSGGSGWPDGVWTLLYSGAIWLAVFLLMDIVALRKLDPSRPRRRLPWLAALLGVFAAAALGGGALAGGLVWSAAPLVCAVSGVVGLRSGRSPVATALFGFGTLGLLLSHRRFFFIEDAPYVGPPLLFAVVCAAGLVSMAVSRERNGASRERLGRGVAVLVALLIGVAFAVRLFEYGRDDRIAIRGTAGFLSARPELAREIEDLGAAIRSGSRDGECLVVFPEGEVLNFLSGRPNPIRHKLYLPGYVNAANEGEIVAELQRASPAAVVIWRRSLGEYGSGPFGENYGREIRRWIDRNYDRQPFRSDAPAGSLFEYYVRRAPGR